MTSLFRRIYRSPTLHFLLLGGIAFALLGEWLREPEVLVIDPAVVQQTVEEWEKFQRAPVTAEQRQKIAEQLARSAVLVQVAREAGLDRTAAVEQRLLKLGRFLDLVAPEAGDAEAVAAARELNLHRTDPVIRRYLENSAEVLLAAGVKEAEISADAIEDYYRRHRERFTVPRKLRLSHVYIGDTGEEGRSRAERLARQIEEEALSVSEAIALGDPFYGGHSLGLRTRRQLAAAMGSRFADEVWELPLRDWTSPISSAYGLHVVLVEAEEPERLQPLEAVREEIVAELVREHQQRQVEQRVAELRNNYRIVGLDAMEGSS